MAFYFIFLLLLFKTKLKAVDENYTGFQQYKANLCTRLSSMQIYFIMVFEFILNKTY